MPDMPSHPATPVQDKTERLNALMGVESWGGRAAKPIPQVPPSNTGEISKQMWEIIKAIPPKDINRFSVLCDAANMVMWGVSSKELEKAHARVTKQADEFFEMANKAIEHELKMYGPEASYRIRNAHHWDPHALPPDRFAHIPPLDNLVQSGWAIINSPAAVIGALIKKSIEAGPDHDAATEMLLAHICAMHDDNPRRVDVHEIVVSVCSAKNQAPATLARRCAQLANLVTGSDHRQVLTAIMERTQSPLKKGAPEAWPELWRALGPNNTMPTACWVVLFSWLGRQAPPHQVDPLINNLLEHLGPEETANEFHRMWSMVAHHGAVLSPQLRRHLITIGLDAAAAAAQPAASFCALCSDVDCWDYPILSDMLMDMTTPEQRLVVLGMANGHKPKGVADFVLKHASSDEMAHLCASQIAEGNMLKADALAALVRDPDSTKIIKKAMWSALQEKSPNINAMLQADILDSVASFDQTSTAPKKRM